MRSSCMSHTCHGESRGSQDYSFKYLLRDTLHISGKPERPQSPEEAGNRFNVTKEAGFGNVPFRKAGGLPSWGGKLPHLVFWGLVLILLFGEFHPTSGFLEI